MSFKDWFKPLASTSSKSLQQHMQAADILKQQYAAQTAAARGKAVAAQGLQGYASPHHQAAINAAMQQYAAQQVATLSTSYQNAMNQQLSNQYPFTPTQMPATSFGNRVVYCATGVGNAVISIGGGGGIGNGNGTFGAAGGGGGAGYATTTSMWPPNVNTYFTPKFDPAWLAEYHEAHEEAVLRRVVEGVSEVPTLTPSFGNPLIWYTERVVAAFRKAMLVDGKWEHDWHREYQTALAVARMKRGVLK